MTLSFRKARLADAPDLAPRLRSMDMRELRAACPEGDVVDLLSNDIAKSDFSWAAAVNGECHALFGVAPFPGRAEVGVPWFLSSELAVQFRREWLGLAPQYLSAMHRLYPTLTNGVHQENSIAIRWLKRMGFKFTNAPLSIRGEPFLMFTRTLYV